MKRFFLVVLLGLFSTLVVNAQIAVKGNVDVQNEAGSKLQLTDTVANKTWELVSGLYSGFQIGYYTGNLTGTTAPFHIDENGLVRIGTATIDPNAALTVGGSLALRGDLMLDTDFGITLNGLPFASASGTSNAFYGISAGSANTTGGNNAFFGNESGKSNTTGNFNAFFGAAAGTSNDTGSKNSFFGFGAGRLTTTGGANSFFGAETGRYNTAGHSNSFFGNESGRANTTGNNNVFVGNSAGRLNTTGGNNTFVGSRSGTANTTASSNSFFGYEAGKSNTTGNSNVFVGLMAGSLNDTGGQNVFVGNETGKSNLIGIRNTFVGTWAGRNNTASNNSFFGYSAGDKNTSGDKNAFFGNVAGLDNTTGANNTYLGYAAGSANNGAKNVYLGSNAGSAGALANENVAIGYLAGQNNSSATGRNTFIGTEAGNNSINGSSNIAIGYRAGEALEGEGNVALGTQAGGSAANGNYNVFLGYEAGLEAADESDRLYIANKRASLREALVYGEFDNGKVGINTTTLEANSALTINGKVAATEYLLADGTPLLSTITTPWTASSSDITFDTGKVGIGTATLDANSALTVAGGLNLTGALKLDTDVVITRNGDDFLTYSSVARNIAFGHAAGNSSMTGERNMFFGRSAGSDNTEGAYNTVFGYVAGGANTTGNNNTIMGYVAGNINTTGSNNAFIGHSSGKGNTTGLSNTYMGYQSGLRNNGSYNTLIGDKAGKESLLGMRNVMVGHGAGRENTNQAGGNTYLGTEAGAVGVNASQNVGIGYRAGYDSEGERNVFIGYNAGNGAALASNRLYIGNDEVSQTGGSLIYGEFDNGKVGINTTTLEANSALTINGKVAATEYLLADGTPLLSTLTTPWTDNSGDIQFTSGRVGIGTGNDVPAGKLEVRGVTVIDGNIKVLEHNDVSGEMTTLAYKFSEGRGWGYNKINDRVFYNGANGLVPFWVDLNSFHFANGGDIGGDLIINGEAEATKLIVTATPGQGWPDYVFEPEFRLRPLSEVEAFVKDNKHLPEVPSAKEVEEKGIDLGNMDATLLKKVEEVTLYLIEMNKKIEKLEEENKKLRELLKKDK